MAEVERGDQASVLGRRGECERPATLSSLTLPSAKLPTAQLTSTSPLHSLTLTKSATGATSTPARKRTQRGRPSETCCQVASEERPTSLCALSPKKLLQRCPCTCRTHTAINTDRRRWKASRSMPLGPALLAVPPFNRANGKHPPSPRQTFSYRSS